MGEYTKFRTDKDVLRRPKEGPHDEAVRLLKETLPKDEPAKLGKEYCALRVKKEKLEEEVKKLNIEIEARSDLLVDWMTNSNISKLGIDDASRTLYIKDNIYSKATNKEQFYSWIKESGLADVLFSVHYQTLNSLVGERLKNGENAPPGVEYYADPKITWR